MAGSDYERCEMCEGKAFYAGEMDTGDCVVFHAECLAKLKANHYRMAAALNIALNEAHVMYGSTATWHGGMGGAAMTLGCAFIDPSPRQEWMDLAGLTQPIRQLMEMDQDVDIQEETEKMRQEFAS